MKQSGLFGLSDHLKRLSANGIRWRPYDAVAMFKVLILAAQNNVSDARMEYLIRDRLS